MGENTPIHLILIVKEWGYMEIAEASHYTDLNFSRVVNNVTVISRLKPKPSNS